MGGASSGENTNPVFGKIGTWINGKPLYNEVIYCKSPTTINSWVNVLDVSYLHIDELVALYGSAKYTTTRLYPVIFVNSVIFHINGTQLQVYVYNNSWINKDMIIQIYHTKTTDVI